MHFEKQVYDQIGNAYERKNQYILDLLKAKGAQRQELIKNRKTHPYHQKLEAFRKKEADFLDQKSKEARKRAEDLTSHKNLQDLYYRYFFAEERYAFYEEYEDLTYDAVLERRIARIEIRQLPAIIDQQVYYEVAVKDKEKELAEIKEEDRARAQEEIQRKLQERRALYAEEVSHLRSSYHEGNISKKALSEGLKAQKRALQEDEKAISFLDPKRSLEDEIKSIRYHLDQDPKAAHRVLESDIADARRRTPIEVEREHGWRAPLSVLIPGLGQWMNGQRKKALFFFLGTLFIYFIAIPYALGFGNYQGQGVYGLISLAEGGRKIDKSIIFMIEGLIALVLLFFSVMLYILSYQDVKRVDRDERRGIRVKNWFETKQSLSTDGFPYLITAPAMVMISFIVLVPIFTAILISFTNMDPSHQSKFNWAGLQNYKILALGQGVAGQAFWRILWWTILWTLGATTLAIFIGFVMALLVNQDRVVGRRFFRTVYLLPWAVPAFITIMFFSLMVARNGIITQVLQNLTGASIDIKNNMVWTRLALICLQGWLGSSYVFLLTTGVLQGIPSDLYEAASIDGATGFQQTSRITIPLVLFQIAPLLIGQYTFNFNNFSIIYLFNGGGPFNPSAYGNLAGSSDILISYIYKLTMENEYQGVGAAITIAISLVLMVIAWIGYRNTAAFKGD